MAVADGVLNAMAGRDCYASVHRIHSWTASIETPAVQWMFRNRMAQAYHDSEVVRAYLESTKGWQDVLSSAVTYLRVAGLHNVKGTPLPSCTNRGLEGQSRVGFTRDDLATVVQTFGKGNKMRYLGRARSRGPT